MFTGIVTDVGDHTTGYVELGELLQRGDHLLRVETGRACVPEREW